MKDSKRMEPLIKLAERIKTDQTIPKKWARKLLAVNRGFQRELRKYFQATEILKGSKKLLENVKNGKMTMEEYQLKIRRASQQVAESELFAQTFSNILQGEKAKRASQTRKDQQEAPSREDSHKSPRLR